MKNTLSGRKTLVASVADEAETDATPAVLPNGLAATEWAEAVEDFLLMIRTSLEEKTAMYYADRMRLLTRWARGVACNGQGVALIDFKARHLRQYLEWRAVQINPITKRAPSDSTRRGDAIAARRLLHFCVQEGYIPADPLTNYQIPKASKPAMPCPSQADMAALLQACQDRWRPSINPDARFISAGERQFFRRRNHALLSGLISTACRVGELLSLRLCDYDAKACTVHFRDTKGDENRTVPFEPAWGELVDLWLKVRPTASESDTLFVTKFGTKIDVDRYRQQFYDDRKLAGLPNLRMHDIRHYAITQIAKKSVLAAQKQAGHKHLSTTQIYAQADTAHMTETHRQAAPLGKILVNVKYEKEQKKSLIGKK